MSRFASFRALGAVFPALCGPLHDRAATPGTYCGISVALHDVENTRIECSNGPY